MTPCSAHFTEHKPWRAVPSMAQCAKKTEAGIPSFPKHDLESEYAVLNYTNVINLGATKFERKKIILHFAGVRKEL